MNIRTKSYELFIDHQRTQRWLDSLNRLHRVNEPAVIYEWGTRMWCENGEQIKIIFSQEDEC